MVVDFVNIVNRQELVSKIKEVVPVVVIVVLVVFIDLEKEEVIYKRVEKEDIYCILEAVKEEGDNDKEVVNVQIIRIKSIVDVVEPVD